MSENVIISMYVIYVSLALGYIECRYYIYMPPLTTTNINTLFSLVRNESMFPSYQLLSQQILSPSTTGASRRPNHPIKLHYDLHSSILFIALFLR